MDSKGEISKHNRRVITGETVEELDNVFDEKETESLERVEAALFIAGKFMNMRELIMPTREVRNDGIPCIAARRSCLTRAGISANHSWPNPAWTHEPSPMRIWLRDRM